MRIPVQSMKDEPRQSIVNQRISVKILKLEIEVTNDNVRICVVIGYLYALDNSVIGRLNQAIAAFSDGAQEIDLIPSYEDLIK
ncbi:hypothetical protein JX265_013293 [Neoarthrinium moseri]|uniref:Uncharacterized protein n=1 Tax=Neoarthrinium moseri TaxID=1658444 RepID=A0A9Q0AHU2_9PEZI|nr:uncharacterized protein JN550_013333 [Neoarthrinium moseri]KAI1843411.1 hypothetical protein JX266_010408 [Neoarthrinium moseri]KAI1850813.1 hypothetical protein JX265_013293 [Neoarthrinium moseri]KAI1857250.1 hypothetical protein JN550_013333 [Neoarthrinium moseri]